MKCKNLKFKFHIKIKFYSIYAFLPPKRWECAVTVYKTMTIDNQNRKFFSTMNAKMARQLLLAILFAYTANCGRLQTFLQSSLYLAYQLLSARCLVAPALLPRLGIFNLSHDFCTYILQKQAAINYLVSSIDPVDIQDESEITSIDNAMYFALIAHFGQYLSSPIALPQLFEKFNGMLRAVRTGFSIISYS